MIFEMGMTRSGLRRRESPVSHVPQTFEEKTRRKYIGLKTTKKREKRKYVPVFLQWVQFSASFFVHGACAVSRVSTKGNAYGRRKSTYVEKK